jgi:hypothetical protein
MTNPNNEKYWDHLLGKRVDFDISSLDHYTDADIAKFKEMYSYLNTNKKPKIKRVIIEYENFELEIGEHRSFGLPGDIEYEDFIKGRVLSLIKGTSLKLADPEELDLVEWRDDLLDQLELLKGVLKEKPKEKPPTNSAALMKLPLSHLKELERMFKLSNTAYKGETYRFQELCDEIAAVIKYREEKPKEESKKGDRLYYMHFYDVDEKLLFNHQYDPNKTLNEILGQHDTELPHGYSLVTTFANQEIPLDLPLFKTNSAEESFLIIKRKEENEELIPIRFEWLDKGNLCFYDHIFDSNTKLYEAIAYYANITKPMKAYNLKGNLLPFDAKLGDLKLVHINTANFQGFLIILKEDE